MKILDFTKTIELNQNEIDLTKGYLKRDSIEHIQPAQEAIVEQGHYELFAEYPETGGKEYEWIIDTPGREEKPEVVKFEDVQVYIPYTEIELLDMQINDLKQELFETDYQALKFIEGCLTEIEYQPIKEQRAEYRKQINILEQNIIALKAKME